MRDLAGVEQGAGVGAFETTFEQCAHDFHDSDLNGVCVFKRWKDEFLGTAEDMVVEVASGLAGESGRAAAVSVDFQVGALPGIRMDRHLVFLASKLLILGRPFTSWIFPSPWYEVELVESVLYRGDISELDENTVVKTSICSFYRVA